MGVPIETKENVKTHNIIKMQAANLMRILEKLALFIMLVVNIQQVLITVDS